MVKKILLVLLAAAAEFSVPAGWAQTVVTGGTDSTNAFPFGASLNGQGLYQSGSQYEQIYSASDFSGPVTITAIGFASASNNGTPGSNVYNFALGLGTTSVTPASPQANFASNGNTTSVFNGPLTAALTSSNNFDLIVPLTTPFSYDPSQGNLLLDVVMNTTSTGTVSQFVAGTSNDVGRVFQLSGNGVATAQGNSGLETEFVVVAVPEPGTISCLTIGAIFAVLVFWRRKPQHVSSTVRRL